MAIKQVQLFPEHGDDERLRVRALREAHAPARLNHPNAVAVYDLVEHHGAVWLVMELVDAPSLAQLVLAALDVAHARRGPHRPRHRRARSAGPTQGASPTAT